jgi:glyoxylase-like metal-dependent hydrolase (beta-lactamase superfamily II)
MPDAERKRIQVNLVPNGGWDSRILVVRCEPVVDAFIVVTQRFVVLVDTFISPTTARELLKIAQDHLDGERQLLVVNTHADWDHTWGNQIFAGRHAEHPAVLIGSRLSAAEFERPESKAHLKEMQANNPGSFDDVQLTPPNLLFDERIQINGGDLTLELFMATGHTHDHAAVYIPEINTLLAGDAAENPYPEARESRLFPQMVATLKQLVGMLPATVLYCHAPGFHDASLLQANLDYFQALETCCREALRRGLPEPLPEDQQLPVLIGCPFEQAIPASLNKPELHEYYRTAGHGKQLRMTLEMLRARGVGREVASI